MGLTKEQQYKLINRYHSGDKDAIKEIIAANEGLVWDSAYKYYNIHKSRLRTVADADDFAQEGYIGLIDGVERFDTSKDVEFSTYVRYWIEHRCRIFARSCYSSLKITTTDYEHLMRKKMCESFGVDCIKSPELDKLDRASRTSSLNIIIGDSYDEMIDLLADNNTKDPLNKCAQASEHDYLQHLFDKYLTEREQHIIKLRTNWDKCLGDFATLQEIGDGMGITRERVRQIENQAYKKLKSHLKNY